jgi:hypothetical protein
MKRRLGEYRACAKARAVREATSTTFANALIWLAKAFSYISMRIGQWAFFALAIAAVYDNRSTETILLLVIAGLILRHTLMARVSSGLITAYNLEAAIRATDPEAENDEMQAPSIFLGG